MLPAWGIFLAGPLSRGAGKDERSWNHLEHDTAGAGWAGADGCQSCWMIRIILWDEDSCREEGSSMLAGMDPFLFHLPLCSGGSLWWLCAGSSDTLVTLW